MSYMKWKIKKLRSIDKWILSRGDVKLCMLGGYFQESFKGWQEAIDKLDIYIKQEKCNHNWHYYDANDLYKCTKCEKELNE